MLRVQPRISPFPPAVKTFDEYCESIGNFMNLNVSRMEELRGPILLTLGPQFISTITASYYGGSINQPDHKRTEFTTTEERVIEILHTGLGETLSNAWTDLMPVTLTPQGREVNPQFASFVDGNELVIICAFPYSIVKWRFNEYGCCLSITDIEAHRIATPVTRPV